MPTFAPPVKLALALLLLVPLTGGAPSAADARKSESSRSVDLAGAPRGSRASAIYAAVIRQLVTKEQAAGRAPKVIYVMSGVVEDAQDPLQAPPDPETPFDPRLREEVRTSLQDLAPVEFVSERRSVLAGDEAASPGRVEDEGVLVSLGPIRGSRARVEVGCSAWRDGKGAVWLTYVVQRHRGDWSVAGTTGAFAIS